MSNHDTLDTTLKILLCSQIPALKEKLREKERQLAEVSSNSVMNGTLHQAVAEAKRQYDAIDAALEVKDTNYTLKSIYLIDVSFRRSMAFNQLLKNVLS